MNGEANTPRSFFGKVLKEHRDRFNWTITDLQRQLEKQGYIISVSTISNYELGKRTPTGGFIAALEHCFGLIEEEVEALFVALGEVFLDERYEEYNEAQRGKRYLYFKY